VLAPPSFHHLHLNSVDPDAAIDFYTTQFSTTSRATWGGFSALASPNDVLILFTQVSAPPPISPQTAIWHFGWHAIDSRASLETYRARTGVKLLPLYTGDADAAVFISSDAWPGTGGVLGRTRSQIAEARATGVEPTRTAGFAYLQGPDNAIVEYAGTYPAERFNHVHMFQEDPLGAELWYQQHLGAKLLTDRPRPAASQTTRGPDRTFPALEREGMFRTPSGGVAFGDVWLPWYMRQGDQPLVGTRGNLYDHIALGVSDFNAWTDKLRSEGVTFLDEPHSLGDTRAVTIAGPSQEAIELVEIQD
jgi:catechol 2,3-dioxygenase-like lactoylglutathione lyase family enzyme